jgi:hypothetical protein
VSFGGKYEKGKLNEGENVRDKVRKGKEKGRKGEEKGRNGKKKEGMGRKRKKGG